MTSEGQTTPGSTRVAGAAIGSANGPIAAPGARSPHSARVGWGWLEVFVVSQTVLPALLFIPGLSAGRTPIRVSAYAIAMAAWVLLSRRGRSGPGASSYPARSWLWVCVFWVGASVLHPNSYSLVAAAAQAALYIAVVSPAFWGPLAVRSKQQLPRMLALLFLCNALSSLVGVAQVFRPETFNPPVIPAMNNAFQGEDLIYEANGQKIMRPCGLTDTPGAVAPAGLAAALLGLCWALRPIALWKRLACVGLAFVGMAAIYYTQVRLTVVMLGISLFTFTVFLAAQKDFRRVALLGVLGTVVVVGASVWVVRSSGDAVNERLMTLFTSDPAKLYQESRGGFVRHAFEEVLWDYPLGYGMGWWGMIHSSFGDPQRPSPIWVEVMWPAWIYDGGFPLLLAYVGALVVAMLDSIRIALWSKDREVAYWGAVIVAFNLSVLATCFSFVAFLSPIGIQFWLLAAALHAADARSRTTENSTPSRGRGQTRPESARRPRLRPLW